jgi:hypothetical protein
VAASSFPRSTRVIKEEEEEECRQGQAAGVKEEGRRVGEKERHVNCGVWLMRRAPSLPSLLPIQVHLVNKVTKETGHVTELNPALLN